MRSKECIPIIILSLAITCIFFYNVFVFGNVAFPGDLLITEYNPWKTYSYLGYAPGAFPSKAQYFDVVRQLYPWKTFSIDLLKKGELPLWNPYNFSGAPLIANFQSGVFYPPNFLYFFVAQQTAWSILVVSQLALVFFFTYLFARKIGIHLLGALLSAVSFAFSSFMIVWVEYNTIVHVIAWFPLILFSFESFLETPKRGYLMLFTLGIVFSLLAGHLQVFATLFFFVLIYIIWRLHSTKKISQLPTFLLLATLAIGIGGIQLFPGIELIRESARVSHQYDFLMRKILIQPWQLVMFFVPDFFGNPATRNYWLSDTYVGKMTSIGVVPLFFVLYSLFSKRKTYVKFFSATALVVLLLTTVNPLTALLYKFNIPLISASAPTLMLFLFSFSLSLLCGLGMNAWWKDKGSLKSYARIVLPLAVVFLLLWGGVVVVSNAFTVLKEEHVWIAVRNLILPTFTLFGGGILFLVSVVREKLKPILFMCLFMLHVAFLFYSFQKFNPFSPSSSVFPDAPLFAFLKREAGIDRFWGYGSAYIEANFATQYSLFSPEGYDPLYPKRYGEFIQSSRDGKVKTEFSVRTRSDAVIAPGFGELDFAKNQYRLKILDILGVKYILDRVENGSTEKTFPKGRFKLVYEKDGWKVFENVRSAPRVFLTSDYKVFTTPDEFEKIFFDKQFDPSKTVLLEEQIDQLNDSNHLTEKTHVELSSYTSNKLLFKVNTETNRLLFLSDTYYPGWNAYIDDEQTTIYRANYAFRAILVPAGQHVVKFTYEPESFKIGKYISGVSVVLAVFMLFFARKVFR